MRSKLWLSILLCLILAVSFSGSAIAADKIKLRFNYTMGAKKPPANGWEWWGAELEKQTNGMVTIEYYPLGSLFKANVAVENIVKGTADISNISIRTTAKRYPLLSVTMLPTVLWPNSDDAIAEASVAIMDLIEEFPEIQQEVKAFKVLWVLMLEDYYLVTKKEVQKPSDLKGMNIGCGGSQATFVKGQGGGAVSVVPPQSYMNLKTGVIDGMIMSWNAMGHYKIHEVCNYMYEMPMGRVPLPMIMNLDSWNGIPKDIQKKMLEIGEKSLLISSRGMREGAIAGERDWNEAGKNTYTPNESEKAVWLKAFEPFEKEWVANASNKYSLEVVQKVLNRWKGMAASSWRRQKALDDCKKWAMK